MAKFFLRTKSTKGSANLYVKVQRPKMGVQWWINSEIEVDIKEWERAQSSAKYLTQYFATENGKKVQTAMNVVEDIIKKFFDELKEVTPDSKKILSDKIHAVARLDATKAEEELQKRELEAIKKKAEEEEKRLCVIWNYYEYFFKGIEDGSIKHGEEQQKRYSATSISTWKTFGNRLKGFLEERNEMGMTFDDIISSKTKSTAFAFVAYLESRGLMKTTINQQKNHFRKLCNMAAEEGYNKNGASLKAWKSHEPKDKEKRAEIVLSDDEINALYDMELQGHIEQCRDVWMLGYFSVQRVSDYSKLRRENFTTNSDGTPVIILEQQKTGQGVEISIWDDRVWELCNKYNYQFPQLKRDAINRGIKEACKILSQSVPTLKDWEVTLLGEKERRKEEWFIGATKRIAAGELLCGEELKRYKKLLQYAKEHDSGEMLYKRDRLGRVIRQRWELVTCHTTRRSRITSLHKGGILKDEEIRSQSGHRSEKNYEKYLKIKNSEVATDIYKKMKGSAQVVEIKRNA